MHPQARPSAPSQAPVSPAPPAALVPRLALLHPSPPRNRPQHHRRPRACPPRGRQTETLRPPTLTLTRQLRAALSSLTTPIPFGFTNRPTGAARDCFFLRPPRSRRRRRPLRYRLRSSRRLRLTPAPRGAARTHAAASTAVAPPSCHAQGPRRPLAPELLSFPTARLSGSHGQAVTAGLTRKRAATESPGRGVFATFC